MSAADDHPADTIIGSTAVLEGGTYERMCAEIDRLRGHSVLLNDTLVRLAKVLDLVPAGATRFVIDPEDIVSLAIGTILEHALCKARP